MQRATLEQPDLLDLRDLVETLVCKACKVHLDPEDRLVQQDSKVFRAVKVRPEQLEALVIIRNKNDAQFKQQQSSYYETTNFRSHWTSWTLWLKRRTGTGWTHRSYRSSRTTGVTWCNRRER